METKVVQTAEYQAIVEVLTQELGTDLMMGPNEVTHLAKAICGAAGIHITEKPTVPSHIMDMVRDKKFRRTPTGWKFIGADHLQYSAAQLREIADWLDIADSDSRISTDWAFYG